MADEATPEAPREKKKSNGAPAKAEGAQRPAGAQSGGGMRDAWKWATGAAVAALLLGGGYLVLKNSESNPGATDVAYNEEPTSNAFTSDSGADGDAKGAEASSAAGANGTPSSSASAARSGASRTIPEETIGVQPANASGRDRDELTVTAKRLVWVRKPSERRLAAMYPTRALERGREGEARLRCRVENDGALDCVRASNAPDRDGFGRAALRVSRTLRHGPRLADGSRAYGSNIRLRVVFRMEEDGRRRG